MHEVTEAPGRRVEKVQETVIVGRLHVPESAQRGEALKVRGADEAENDDTEQEPGRVSRKKRAKGGEHLVKISESKHAVPLVRE